MTDKAEVNAPTNRGQVLATVTERLDDMTRDWDRDDLTGDISGTTLMRGHLGFSSMDLVMLVVDIQGFYRRQDLPWEQLFAPLGSYVDDVKVDEIVDFLCRYLESPAPPHKGPT